MKYVAGLFFLLMFLENFAYAEEYRVEDGKVLVLRTENYIRFEYTSDSYSQGLYAQYLYTLRGDNRGFRELRIFQADRHPIFITANTQREIIRVGVDGSNCYCALWQCEKTCSVGRALFNLWTRKLYADRHLANPNRLLLPKNKKGGQCWKRQTRC